MVHYAGTGDGLTGPRRPLDKTQRGSQGSFNGFYLVEIEFGEVRGREDLREVDLHLGGIKLMAQNPVI